ncbi:hypothetical protein GCM10008932_12700 [Alkalibacterium iburiense]|uniref:Uncharacterized protein n=1 Tax=Alkalibacterium iburiense TaxID=290589 RepID=A0ABN0XDJ0_9LACT
MKRNNKLFLGVTVTVCLFIVSSYLLLSHLRLDKPVFMKHYYEAPVNRESNSSLANPLPFSYITNRNDSRVVVGLEFLDYPDIEIYASEHQEGMDGQYIENQMNTLGYGVGPYSIRHVNWEIGYLPEDMSINEIELSDVRVLFDDSNELITNIGEIHLREQPNAMDALNHQYVSSSSDGQSLSRFLVTEDITLSSIESPLLSRFKDRLEIKINEEPISDAVGKEFKQGEYLTVSSEIAPTGEELSDDRLFSIQPLMSFKHENGTYSEYPILNLNDTRLEYSVSNIYKFVNERGVN